MTTDEHALTNQEKLDEMYEMTLENHDILKSIKRSTNLSNAFSFLYWIVIIGSIGGAYIFVSPLINSFLANKDKIQSTIEQVNQVSSMGGAEKEMVNKLMEMQKAKGIDPAAVAK
jgi:hypothetical protein